MMSAAYADAPSEAARSDVAIVNFEITCKAAISTSLITRILHLHLVYFSD